MLLFLAVAGFGLFFSSLFILPYTQDTDYIECSIFWSDDLFFSFSSIILVEAFSNYSDCLNMFPNSGSNTRCFKRDIDRVSQKRSKTAFKNHSGD